MDSNRIQCFELHAIKMASKSQIEKIDKSITHKTETHLNSYGQPLWLVSAEMEQQRLHFDFNHTIANNDASTNFAEPVRSSFETTAMPISKTEKVSTVAFRTTEQEHQTTKVTKTTTTATRADLLSLSPASAVHFDGIGTREVKIWMQELCDDNEITLQASTSPESYVDHVLSAASSVSLCSSLSSSIEKSFQDFIEMYDAGVAYGAILPKKHTNLHSATMKTNRTSNLNALNKFDTINDGVDTIEMRKQQPEQHLHSQQLQSLVTKSETVQPVLSETPQMSNSRNPSPVQLNSTSITTHYPNAFPEQYKCAICGEVFCDPRTLNCLHTFCLQCLMLDQNSKQNNGDAPSCAQLDAQDSECKINGTSKEPSSRLSAENTTGDEGSTKHRHRSSFRFVRLPKDAHDRPFIKSRTARRPSEPIVGNAEASTVQCKSCRCSTELPAGGLRQLPRNTQLLRKIAEFKLKVADEIWCSLCFDKTEATHRCITCDLHLCILCKTAHERQRSTAEHHIQNILQHRDTEKKNRQRRQDESTMCQLHPDFEMKSFCSLCLQLSCSECLTLLHKGHKHESICRASKKYSKLLSEKAEQIRPLCSIAQHSVDHLKEIAMKINQKCDSVKDEVDEFMAQYRVAVEVHRRTLLEQVQKARTSTLEMILAQQQDLAQRTAEAKDAIRFSQELAEFGSDTELLAFAGILLKRFELCSYFKAPRDPKLSDHLRFLPHLAAPSTKAQNNIPLFGIITMQTVEAAYCTLKTEGVTHLRLHRKVELLMQARDVDGAPLCHGGAKPKAQLRYTECITKILPVEVADNRDGTYAVSFIPGAQGTILLTICIRDKPIRGSPFTFVACSVQPHNGIYHCCAFCSSRGSKQAKCACPGRMPGYNGCGHGHDGHPGHRHWSCCGNVLEKSECSVANKFFSGSEKFYKYL